MEREGAFYFSDIEKKFEFYHIEWVIENISVALCEKECTIYGPEFIAERPERSAWVIAIKLAGNLDDREVLFILKRLRLATKPAHFWVDLKPHIITAYKGVDTHFYSDVVTYSFEEITEYSIPLNFIKHYFKNSEPFKFDWLRVGCDLLIYNRNIGNRLKQCKDIGLKLLSENLFSILDSERYHDVQLLFGDHTVLAHKAIINARCKRINFSIESESTVDVSSKMHYMDLTDYNYAPLRKILEYLYSGDLNYVHEKPSIDIYEYACAWEIQEIIDLYSRDKITFRTSMQTQEHSYNWIITNFCEKCERDNPISSPRITENSFATTWQIHLYSKILETEEYVALSAETFEDIPSLDTYLELAIVNVSGHPYLSKTVQYSDKKKFELMKFPKRDLVEGYVADDVLRLTFKLRFIKSKRETVLERQVSNFRTYNREDNSFLILSEDLENMLITSDDSDSQVHSAKVFFPIHKCILAARCPTFDSMFVGTHDTYEFYNVSIVPSRTLPALLTYIYSGVVQNVYQSAELTELKEAAEIFGLPQLQNSCLENLRKAGYF